MHYLNDLRLLSGLPILKELEMAKKAPEVETIIERDDIDVGFPITKGGKHRFILVQGAGPDSTIADIISEVDTLALVDIARGAGAKGPGQESWELFPVNKKAEAMALAERRLEKAQVKDPVGDDTVVEAESAEYKKINAMHKETNRKGNEKRRANRTPEEVEKDKKRNAAISKLAVNEGKKADKDYDKDGKVESPEAEHKGSVDKAIKKSKKEDKEEKVTEGKKADKDYDKDGKVESSEDEHKGSVDKAIKKSKKEDKEDVKEGKETPQPVVDDGKPNLWNGFKDKDENPKPNKDKQSIEKGEEKVPCPANLLKQLKTEIGEAEKEAKYYEDRCTETSNWYGTLATAMGHLHDCLKQGTHESMQKAQLEFSSWMSIMQHKVPSEVTDFIMKGGQSRGLKDFYKEVKVKAAKGVDPTKGNYVG